MLKRLTVIVAAVLAVALHAAPLLAQTLQTPQSLKPDFSATLIAGGVDRSDPTIAWVGVHVRLGPGWHTYWRSPGDAGAPPEFDWRGSRNVAGVDVEYPAPRRITSAGIDTFGYEHAVVFPVRLRLRDSNAPTKVSLKLALFVCSQICTRNDLTLHATLAPGARFDGPMGLIDKWRAKVPGKNTPELSIGKIELTPTPKPHLDVTVTSVVPLVRPDLFVDGDNDIFAGRPQRASHAGNTTTFAIPLDGSKAAHPAKPLRVTLVDGGRAVEAVMPPPAGAAAATVKPAAAATPSTPAPVALWTMLAVALLGGLILNFMPCVFPVLSLKIFSLVAHTTRDTRAVRLRFVASAIGVVASFLLLAATLAGLKALGAQVGWGIQFQQPLFLVAMAAILVALAANLLDLYDIHLPARLGGVVGQGAGHDSMAAHFFNGLVMTLLATPCSAPFVGTAVGFALSQGTAQIVMIFAALGFGMASPYLMLAAVPAVARFFPRPGPWMVTVRRVAAVAIAGTAIWLLTVLAKISGVQTALAVGAVFGLLVWLLAVRRQRFAHAIAGMLIAGLAGVAILVAGDKPRSVLAEAVDGVQWQPLAPHKIGMLVRDGRTVFVDIGAAWCVTCKVNDALIVGSHGIRARLRRDVVPMQADWTKPDDKIADYLRRFHRYGLPFNAVFGPGAPNGIVLPELLTQEAVLAAFDKASMKSASN
ncbi:MAG: protein-disulfide reductase DsbD family protein [Pseudolabrys sp.]